MVRMKRYLVLLLPLLVLIACDPVDQFGDYRDVNLIDGKGFDSGVWEPDRDESYYMNFEEVSSSIAGSTGDLPDDSGIYRLEIPNLVPNGDFEGSTVGGGVPSPWVLINTSGLSSADVVDTSSSYDINGNTFYYDIDDKETDRINYDMQSNLKDGFKEGKNYIIRFNIRSDGYTSFEYNDGSSGFPGYSWTLQAGTDMSIRSFPDENIISLITAQSGATHNFTIGALDPDVQRVQTAYIDNFRVVRTDIDQFVRYEVPVVDSSGSRPELIDGYYKFSVYIKEDPTNTTIQSADKVANRFPASGVTLQMALKYDDEVYKTSAPAAFHPDDEDTDWSEWTKVTLTSGDAFSVTQFGTTEKVFIELRITPTDAAQAGNNKDAGSLLIASPSLEYLPDGS